MSSSWGNFVRRLPRPGRVLRVPADYTGSRRVVIAATQLDVGSREGARIVGEWMDFFASPHPSVREIEFTTRTPDRLFRSLAPQRQVEALTVKWGDYDGLETLSEWTNLRSLNLRGGSAVTSVAPLSALTSLELLVLDSLHKVGDYSSVGDLGRLSSLEIGGPVSGLRVHLDSIAFLRRLARLRSLWIHTAIVRDLDYSPILELTDLREMRVMVTRGMRPSHPELIAGLPKLREWQ